MKLTKSQRLFIRAGRLEGKIEIYKGDDLDHYVGKLRKERKKLIREAIEAAILEEEGIYDDALKEAFTLPWDL